jgi:hypothetical protein
MYKESGGEKEGTLSKICISGATNILKPERYFYLNLSESPHDGGKIVHRHRRNKTSFLLYDITPLQYLSI